MGLTDKITGAILVGLFVFALLTFGYGFQTENGVSETILDDKHFSKVNGSISAELQNVSGSANKQKADFEGEAPQSGETGDNFGLLSLVKIVPNFISMMFGSFNAVTGVLVSTLGIPRIIFNIVGGLLVVILIILSWRVYKGGGT